MHSVGQMSVLHANIAVDCISLLYLDLYVLGFSIDKLGVFHANQITMCLDPHLN